MAILLIGGTGLIGSLVTQELVNRGAAVATLGLSGARGDTPSSIEHIKGDVLNIDLMRDTLPRFSTLFVLNPASPDELTRALLTLKLAEEAGVRRIVYFSMINADTFVDVPHATAKRGAERMIEEMRLPATILRPNAFFQNDLQQKTPLMEKGTYVMPIGGVGVEMVDARDIADVAAAELVRREESPEPLPRETIEIVGPEAFTGPSIAALWSEVLGRHVSYAGDDLRAAERLFRAQMPGAMAYDMALMLRDFHLHGMLGTPGAAERLTARLKRPLRTYRAFAEEAAAEWQKPLLAKVAGTALRGRADRRRR